MKYSMLGWLSCSSRMMFLLLLSSLGLESLDMLKFHAEANLHFFTGLLIEDGSEWRCYGWTDENVENKKRFQASNTSVICSY